MSLHHTRYTRPKRKYATHLGAVAFGVGLLGAPATPSAQSQKAPAAPPPPAAAAPAPAPPPPGAAAPLPPGTPPPGAQPGQPPYPYPYPYPYGQPGYPYPPPPPGYGYPPAAPAETEERKPVMPYKGGLVPPGYVLEERIRKGLVIGGSVVFGTFYLFSAAGAAAAESTRTPWAALYVPVIGPFIVAGAGNFSGSDNYARPLFIFDGLVQAGGVAMLVAGIVAKQKVLVREDLAAGPEFFVGPRSVGMKMSF
ncbi:hypothetical protein [Polyangium sp. 15x6]|uniref:hypothetical protein n=1 Tax=Polyangium sp. 15x6 TaxID=3042687 RepID=UPI00249CDC41|nr:hypothetical protein [Polyangium sp. 15x6]MDI3281876.1 hypothetical protein [Polyangium sp. 15x6]